MSSLKFLQACEIHEVTKHEVKTWVNDVNLNIPKWLSH